MADAHLDQNAGDAIRQFVEFAGRQTDVLPDDRFF